MRELFLSSRRRRLAIVGGLLLVMVVALGFAISRASPRSISYWIIDDRTLGIQVIDGPNSSCRVAATEESATEVRVHAECRPPFLSAGSTGAGYPYHFNVQLQAPLGGRVVFDAFGTRAERCTTARCGLPG